MSDNHLYLSPEQFTALDKAIQECVQSNFRIEGEKSFQKDVSARIKDELGIKPAEFNKLVSEYFDNKVSDNIQKLESILEIKEQIDTAIKNAKA
jgi:protein-disulfide isomerase-like protein with CxxC motif